MKHIFLMLTILGSITLLATEKDTLNQYRNFKKFYNLLDDCDACGCSANGGSMGFSSIINPNFIGIRYFNQTYKSTNGLYSNSAWYNEHFNTIQVWGRIPIKSKIQVSVLTPYHFHHRDSDKGKQSISGIGDITLLGFYTLVQSPDTLSYKHKLWIGTGIKIPTGTYNQTNNGSLNPSYQLGTGSWDYTLALEYIVKYKNVGINSSVTNILKTENSKGYRFGNQFNYASTVFYLWNTAKHWLIVPQAGIAGEVYGSNYQHRQKLNNTLGDICFGKLGVEVGKKNFSLGTSFMKPLTQHLSSGNVKAQYRWMLNLNYSL